MMQGGVLLGGRLMHFGACRDLCCIVTLRFRPPLDKVSSCMGGPAHYVNAYSLGEFSV